MKGAAVWWSNRFIARCQWPGVLCATFMGELLPIFHCGLVSSGSFCITVWHFVLPHHPVFFMRNVSKRCKMLSKWSFVLTLNIYDPIKAKCYGVKRKSSKCEWKKQTFYSALSWSYTSLYQITLAKLCVSILNCVCDIEMKVSSNVILPYAFMLFLLKSSKFA